MAGLIPKQQIFTSSGTFTPSARLLALGGWVEVICVGGGGGGYYPGSGTFMSGGGGGAVVRKIVQVTGNVTVTIGAGGTGGSNPTQGGTTSFGSLVTAIGGYPGGASYGGASGNGLISSNTGGAGAGGSPLAMPLIVGGYYTWSLGGTICLGGPNLWGYGGGGCGTSNNSYYDFYTFAGPPNTGRGGTRDSGGTSGICIVEWFE
jgi:hypothetical protein